MALVIRMRQQGATNRQTFRLVVTDIRNPRDGKYLEMLGWYDPSKEEAKNLSIDVPRLQFWIDNGAVVSDRVKSLVKRYAPEVVQQMSARKVEKMAKERAKRKKKS
ncbi:MAG TPA: 30S ribosomal protein S16 [Parachlamydiales bacterium]|nr:30S ribosomal protein S16 [Parachlamydiales bacterium]